MRPYNLFEIGNILRLLSYVNSTICYFVSFFNFSFSNAKNRKLKTLLFTLSVFFFLSVTKGQTYPVQINAQLVPPYSGYLPDYGDPNAQNLKLFLRRSVNLRLLFPQS